MRLCVLFHRISEKQMKMRLPETFALNMPSNNNAATMWYLFRIEYHLHQTNNMKPTLVSNSWKISAFSWKIISIQTFFFPFHRTKRSHRMELIITVSILAHTLRILLATCLLNERRANHCFIVITLVSFECAFITQIYYSINVHFAFASLWIVTPYSKR